MSLDDFMRAMWQKFGKRSGREGYVEGPYTIADAEETLATVSADRAFAHEFFRRYIQGHDVADYAALLTRAGFTLRKRNPGRAWLGDLRFDSRNGLRLGALVAPTWPIYAAGIDQDDELKQVDGQAMRSESDLATVLQRHKPGDTIAIVFTDRTARPRAASVRLADDPHAEVAAIASPSEAQKAFRDRWLGAK